ncbi:hypothetical protein RYZ26_06265 [Terasakiella sp. A23]|uniref:hypothetical protein n=1 Tax=Terasakiella sp. FCG-A23 TaxID=3080561 RepID=UPI0029558ABF|nr:hypothetical protein [Terasakiella sp. A23]MDV7339188.1 hypothetical protein [Terasakiella sp. A23]
MDIYENIVIGNFLVGLGYEIRELGNELGVSVNLLQQTPMDTEIGDILIQGLKSLVILEFKRHESSSDKETQKVDALKDALHSERNRDLQPVSRSIHWYIESENRDESFTCHASPYLDYKENLSDIALDKLVKKVAKSIVNPPADANWTQLCISYLDLLRTLYKKRKTSSGALIFFASDSGFKYLAVSNFSDLSKSLGKALAHNLEKSNDHVPEFKRVYQRGL